MSRYRKTMAEAYGAVVENSAIQMQIAALKKAYEPMRNKKISMDNANKLMKIMDKFDGDKNMLSMLYKSDIPFVSGLASARLISKHNFKAQQLMKIRKEDVDKLTDEVKQIREAREKDLEDFEEDLVGDEINEGRMKDIYTMQQAGKSAEEIAKKMKLPVKTVKDILGEVKEEIHEFKKMSVTIRDMDKRKKAITDLQKQNLGVAVHGGVIKVDGKGKDLNNFAKDLMNFYGANVVAEETIEEGITPQMIATLKKEYEPFRGKKISAARARQLMNILNKFKDSDLQKLGKENIPFISSGSRSKLAVRNMKFTVKNIEFGEELDEEMFEACWTGYKQVGMKKKGNKQVPNCVPEAVKKENAPSEADIERLKKQGMKPRKEQKDHPAAAVYESIAAVKKKTEKSGMPYGV